jgi:hypothetical protein
VAREAFHLIGDVRLVRERNRLGHGRYAAERQSASGNQEEKDNRSENKFAHRFVGRENAAVYRGSNRNV